VNEERLVTPAGATIDGSSSCDTFEDICCFAGGGDVWYCVNPCCPCPITVAACSPTGVTVSVHTDCPGTAANQVACNMSGPGGPCPPGSWLTFMPTPGQPYYIRLAWCGGSCTPNPFFVLLTQPNCVPSNNACAAAIPLTAPIANQPFSTCGATTDGPTDCPGFNDIWYTFVPPTGVCANVIVSASEVCNFQPSIGIYCDGCPGVGLMTCSRDTVYNPNCPTLSGFASVRFYAEGGRSFRIRLGGAANNTGSGPINLTFTPAAMPNDLCSGAIPIVPGRDVFGATWCATASDPGVCFPGNLDVWYVFSPACPGNYTINLCEPGLCGPAYDTVLSVYNGCPASGGVELACNDNFCGLQSLVSFTAVACQSCYIRVAGAGTARGDRVRTAHAAGVQRRPGRAVLPGRRSGAGVPRTGAVVPSVCRHREHQLLHPCRLADQRQLRVRTAQQCWA